VDGIPKFQIPINSLVVFRSPNRGNVGSIPRDTCKMVRYSCIWACINGKKLAFRPREHRLLFGVADKSFSQNTN
jgi:hypothetical protein